MTIDSNPFSYSVHTAFCARVTFTNSDQSTPIYFRAYDELGNAVDNVIRYNQPYVSNVLCLNGNYNTMSRKPEGKDWRYGP